MNPINDQMPTKDVEKPLDLDKTAELSNNFANNLQKSTTSENIDGNDQQEIEENDTANKVDDNVNIQESEDSEINAHNKDINTNNEKNSESKEIEKNVSEEAVENDTKNISKETAESHKEQPNVENDTKDITEEIAEDTKQQSDGDNVPQNVDNEIVENSKKQPDVQTDLNDISNEIIENSKENPDSGNNPKDVRDEIDEKCEQQQQKEQQEISEEITTINSRQQSDVEKDQKDIGEEIDENSKQESDVEKDQKDIGEEIDENSKQQSDVENDREEISEEIDVNSKEQSDVESDRKTNKEKYDVIEDTKEKARELLTEPASDEDFEDLEDDEDLEDPEDVEDVEIPGDEEVDEIIVPDEAEAEDLTDGKDNEDLMENSRHANMDDEEDASTNGSEMDDNDLNEEEDDCKSSEEADKNEGSDKKSINGDAKEDTCSKDYDESDNEASPPQSESVALEDGIKNVDSASEEAKSNEPNSDEDTTTSQATYDPLNYTNNKAQNAADDNEVTEIANDEKSEDEVNEVNDDNDVSEVVPCDEEDDEVQFVETRNSPICIESDDDDDNDVVNSKDTADALVTAFNINENDVNKQTITTNTTTVTVSKNITVTRTSARKSTAKPQQQNQLTFKNIPKTMPQMENKSNRNNKSIENYPRAAIHNKNRAFIGRTTQQIVDCIELLDSSDEESTASNRGRLTPQQKPAQQKTPQKRTLWAAKGNYYKNNSSKPTTSTISSRLPHNITPPVRQQPKKPAPPPLPPATPQSNFLNAVQLQPASVTGSNPPAFSALLSNKSVIIPNAFYGNPPNVRVSPEVEIERRYCRWLDNFLNQFCKPQFEPTHSCFVFLQRALKYKDFVRIKALRANMNSYVQSGNTQPNVELMADLKTIFFKTPRKPTNYGSRFCELTCSIVPGKTVALIAHGVSGKVTLKTCNMDLPKSTNTATSSTSSTSCSSSSTNTLTRKRQLDEDEDDEYTPDISKFKTSENGSEDSSEMGDHRKRSLRSKRTKRLDNSFSYNEDDLLAEYEIDDEDDEKLAQVEIQRKIEQKRLEAQKQRQQQVKSFESAFIQAFTRYGDSPTTSKPLKSDLKMQRIRLRNTTAATATTIRKHTENNDAEDLLQATWIENHENDEAQIISDDDEPKVHRIYKQQKEQLEDQEEYYPPPVATLSSTQKRKSVSSRRTSKRNQGEVITGDDYEENNYYINAAPPDDPNYWPKNIDSEMYVSGKFKDRCVICNLNCQRLVHHYVNEHRGCEVYNSRLSLPQVRALKQGKCTVSEVSLYKNGQFQYEAYCIFCQKVSRFMFPYWYQHFTMHTGEYAYRCIGCGIRKPTRSLLTQHQAQGCPEEGGVAQDYANDSKTLQIEGKICTICNYVQLHRSNIVKHLHTQHNIKQILPKHIQTIVLLKTPAGMAAMATKHAAASTAGGNSKRPSTRQSASRVSNTYIINNDDTDITYEEILPEESQPQINAENNYYNYIPPYMQAAFNAGNFTFEEVDEGEDLSYMICGMLDVQQENQPEAN